MVGNAVGAGNKTLAFDISKLSLKIIVCLELFMGVVLYFGGTYFAGLFTNESSVLSICQLSMSFMAFFVLVDGVFGVISGILRGAGKQAVGAITNICSFYIVGLPVAAIFCFKTDFGVPGLLMGMSIAACLQDVIVTTYIFRDPEKVFERVAEESADEVNSPLTKEAEMVKIDSFEEDEKDCDEEEITL
jgi:MATE family multidrug resistance protein